MGPKATNFNAHETCKRAEEDCWRGTAPSVWCGWELTYKAPPGRAFSSASATLECAGTQSL